MKKLEFMMPEFTIIKFDVADVITTSGTNLSNGVVVGRKQSWEDLGLQYKDKLIEGKDFV